MQQGLQFAVGAVSAISNPASGIHVLARKVAEDAKLKYDFHIKGSKIGYVTEQGKGTMLRAHDHGAFQVNDNAHRQVRTYTGMDAKYYERIKDEFTTVMVDGKPTVKSLLDVNVNHWLQGSDDTRLIRTKDGIFRAFLSDRYRPMDNEDLLAAIIPTLLEMGGDLEVASCQVTDAKLYLKLISKSRWREVGVGSIVSVGVCIENDECGNGSMSAIPFSYNKACENGMKHIAYGTRRNHVAGRIDLGDKASAVFTNETLKADDQAYWLKFRDIVKAALSDEILNSIVKEMNEAAGIVISSPMEALDAAANKYRLNDREKIVALENLLSGADGAGSRNLWGLANSITFTAGQVDDYDRASELEAIGGDILGLATKGGTELKELVYAGSR